MTHPASQSVGHPHEFLIGGGEMGERIRAFDWSRTPLGPIASWSPALRMMVRFLLANRFPLLLWWGPQYIQIYNDPYRPIPGAKHPHKAFGCLASDCWSEIWHIIGPLIDTPFNGGPATWMDDIELEMNRYGFVEETHFTIAYSPVPDDSVSSGIGGVLATVHEITEKVVGERRVVALRDLGAQAAEARTAEDACRLAAKTLAAHDKDIPFALIYLIDADGRQARLAGSTGVAMDGQGCPSVLNLEAGEESRSPFADVVRTETMQVVGNLSDRFCGAVPPGPWSDPPREAVILPIRSNIAHQLAGVLVAGVSARLKLDELYRSFYELIAGQIATAIANARAYEEEKKRAEALAEIDRAKTQFFSNVSHEFRTPLTLMLGSLEEELEARPPTPHLQVAHRNSLRLLKLVNQLLDFSRIEAGRMQARYVPTDLARFTEELTSLFRSTMEKGGLRLSVECLPLSQPVYVDRDMWEKIVLNLLSNAFKFTFFGEVAVSLRPVDRHVELTVRDTGIGMAAEELPRLFERFHRIEGARSRTHEGTGIGLALVQELVKLHGGSIDVESVLGRGSTFNVRIPFGTAHLPHEQVQRSTALEAAPAPQAAAFIEEALRWLPEDESSETLGGRGGITHEVQSETVALYLTPDASRSKRPRVLLADDNADMRQYLLRLLSGRYDVETAIDGEAALIAARRQRPDLIVSDVMMPKLDGFALLRALRQDASLQTIPVILLSARAGEESRIEGLEHGADDYLIKPFNARELLARVGAHLDMARVRRENEERKAADLRAMAQLYEVGNRCVRAGNDFEANVKAILEAAISLTGADKGNIQLLDTAGGTLRIAAQRGFEEPFLRFFASVLSDEASACGAAFRSGERVIVEDVTQNELFRGHASLDVLLEAGVRAVQSTPLISSRGTVLGMISTHFNHPHRPNERELRLMDLLAQQAADYLELKQAEQSIRENEERFRAFTSATNDVVYRMSSDWTEMRHLQGREFIADTLEPSRTWLDTYIHPEDQHYVMGTIQRAIRAKSVFELEHRVIRVDGSLGWTYSRAIPILDDRGEILEWFGAASDVTQRKQAEEALHRFTEQLEQQVTARTAELLESQGRLRALASELNLAEQRERRRLATELHDHLQQMLVFGKITVGQGKKVAGRVPDCEAVLQKIDDIFSDALTYSRTLVAELSPPVLREYGLAASLKWLAGYMQKKHNHTVTVIVPEGEPITVPEDRTLLLFQSVRELLINSAKHAGTGEATVIMEQQEGILSITVSDEGQGFDLAAAGAAGTPSGGISSRFGLYSIQERMRALGGSFTIDSSQGQGTNATLVLPVARSAETRELSAQFPQPENAHAAAGAAEADDHTKGRTIVQVLLVDDHAMMRQGLRSVLDAYADIQVVGEAKDGVEALTLVEELRPRVVVMDINMPRMNGIDATAHIKTHWPGTTVIGISVNAGDDNSEAMKRAGAVTVVPKDMAVDQLHDVIVQEVNTSGDNFIQPH